MPQTTAVSVTVFPLSVRVVRSHCLIVPLPGAMTMSRRPPAAQVTSIVIYAPHVQAKLQAPEPASAVDASGPASLATLPPSPPSCPPSAGAVAFTPLSPAPPSRLPSDGASVAPIASLAESLVASVGVAASSALDPSSASPVASSTVASAAPSSVAKPASAVSSPWRAVPSLCPASFAGKVAVSLLSPPHAATRTAPGRPRETIARDQWRVIDGLRGRASSAHARKSRAFRKDTVGSRRPAIGGRLAHRDRLRQIWPSGARHDPELLQARGQRGGLDPQQVGGAPAAVDAAARRLQRGQQVLLLEATYAGSRHAGLAADRTLGDRRSPAPGRRGLGRCGSRSHGRQRQ